jgi:hypothetical protein
MNKKLAPLAAFVVTSLVASPAFAQLDAVGSTGVTGFDNLMATVFRLVQAVSLLGCLIFLGMAGVAKSSGAPDANERISNAIQGSAICFGAPIILEIIKRAMGV